MSRKNSITRKMKALNKELVHMQHSAHSHFVKGGSMKVASKFLKEYQDKIENIKIEIRDLNIEYYNSSDAKNNMYQVVAYIEELMAGLAFAITHTKVDFEGKYSYIMKLNIRINVDFIKNDLEFLTLLYNAEVLVDENTIQVNIFPKHLDRELFNKIDLKNYIKSFKPINKFQL